MTPEITTALKDWLDVYGKCRRHAGLPAGENVIVAEIDSISVGLKVSSEMIVEEAGYQAPEGAQVAALLEMYARLSIGSPAREVAEHGVARMLGYARTAGAVAGGKGVLLPVNAGYPFNFVQELSGKLLQDERLLSNIRDLRNEHHQPPANPWQILKKAERISSLKREIVGYLAGAGQPADFIQLAALEKDIDGFEVRVVIDFGFGIEPAAKPGMVRALESHLKANLDRTLQVYVVERKDESKLRRL